MKFKSYQSWIKQNIPTELLGYFLIIFTLKRPADTLDPKSGFPPQTPYEGCWAFPYLKDKVLTCHFCLSYYFYFTLLPSVFPFPVFSFRLYAFFTFQFWIVIFKHVDIYIYVYMCLAFQKVRFLGLQKQYVRKYWNNFLYF